MKMHEEDLIKARCITRDLLVQSLKEFMFSMFALLGASILIEVFYPEVMNKASGLIWLLLGMVFGIVIGCAKAYNVFWEKLKFKER